MKLPICLMLLAAAQAFSTAQAATLTGNISANTTLTKANSPYIVDDNLTVEAGATLTIEPGVELHIRPVVYITIDGGMRAEGTATEPVIFKSLTADKWRGIKVRPGSADSIIFRYCHLENNKEGFAIHKRPFVLANSKVINTLKLYLETCDYSITSSTLRTCEIFTEGGSKGVIRDNDIHHTMTGINLHRDVSSSITNNRIYNNAKGISVAGEQGSMINQVIEISGNRILSNTGVGVVLKTCNIGANFKNNIIAGNAGGVSIYKVMGVMSENTFKHNKTSLDFSLVSQDEFNFYSNCIDSTGELLVRNKSSEDIILANNYWGTQDTTKMHAMTEDYYTDFVSGKVFYSPADAGSPHCQPATLFPVGVKEVASAIEDVKIYPNPFNEHVTIEISNPAAIASVGVYNILGVELSSTTAVTTKMYINLGSHPAGVYIYKVLGKNNEIISGRVLKQ